jgi:hypothetical protein
LTGDEQEEFAVYAMYKDMSNDALKDVLRYVQTLMTPFLVTHKGSTRLIPKHIIYLLSQSFSWNLQMNSGTKPILLARCMDGQMRGRLARCPLCLKGKVAIRDEHLKEASCNGYYDETMGGRVPCSYKESVHTVGRLHPWFSEQPTKEEESAIQDMDDPSKTGTLSSKVMEGLHVRVNDLEWKTSNKADIQKSTADML